MRMIVDAVDRISRAAAYVAAAILVFMVGHILLEIVLRNLFDTSTFVTAEFVGYGVAAMTYLGLAFSLRTGALIRVNMLLVRLHGPARRAAEMLCVAMTLALTVFLGWYFWRQLARDYTRGTVSYSIAEVPVWIPEGLVFAGIALFGLQLFAYLVRLGLGDPPIAEDVGGE